MSAALAAAPVAILNTRPTLLHLPPLMSVTEIAGDKRPELGTPTSLMPGKPTAPVMTLVPADVWERSAKHPAVKQWLAAGWIREKPADVQAPTEAPPPLSLADVKEQTALAMVESENNPDTLNMWGRAEKRAPVREAIAKKLTSGIAPKK